MRAIACAAIVALCAAGFMLKANHVGGGSKQAGAVEDTGQNPASKSAAHITAEQLKGYLEFISSDELEGRDTPSRGLDIAAKFIALHLSRWGLKPMGDPGSYFQRIQLRRDRIDQAHTIIKLNDQSFNCGDDFLTLLSGFAGTKVGPLVYVGDGWMIKAKNLNPYQGIDVKGKILITNNVGLPPGVSDADLSGKPGETWDYPAMYAQRHGAAGIILIPPQETLSNWGASAPGEARTKLHRRSLPGGTRRPGRAPLSLPRLPIVIASAALTNALFRGEKRDPAEFSGAMPKVNCRPPSISIRIKR